MKIPLDFSSYLLHIHLMEKNNLIAKLINYSWFKFFTKVVIKKINYIRTLNEKMYVDLIKLHFPGDRILKIPNGINSRGYFKIKKKEHPNIHYGFVGRLTEFKNLKFLLDVFKLYLESYPEDKLFIYGKGSEEKYISDFIQNNNLKENIILHGFEKDKAVIYSNIDVVIDPAFGQGISNANLEAMCTNTFVIASNVFGNIDIIKNNITGLLFNPFDKNSLLKKLKFYKENSKLSSEILLNARNEVLKNYDIDIITSKIYNFLKTRNEIQCKAKRDLYS